MVDALGRRTQMTYDSKNQLLETIYDDDTPETDTDNQRIKYDYDVLGNKTGITDQYGRRTVYSYDALKRPTGMILPDSTPETDTDNARVDVEYNQLGWMKALVKNGVRTEFEYDKTGRMILSRNWQDGQAMETSTMFDQAGRAIAKTDDLGRTTRYVYDEMDRLVQTLYVDGTRTKTTYNAFGKETSKTDQAGRVTRYEYDALDQLTAVVDVLDHRTEYRYNEDGGLVYQEDANDQITRYEYDGLERRVAVIRPLGQRSETTYNKAGNVVQTQDFDGDIITYEYDKTNQLLAKHYVSEGHTTTFTTAANGRERTVTDERGLTHSTYDERGRLLEKVEPDGRSIAYTYDGATGKVATVTTPSGTTRYRYNSLGQLAKVIAPEGETTYAYNAIGNLAEQRLPNGVTQAYQYDNLNRVEVLETKAADGTVLARYAYTYDAVGNKTAVEELGGRKVEYTYDALYRLTKEVITDSVNGNRAIEYVYDNVGNRLTKRDSIEGETTYSYNNNDWLLSETTGGQSTSYTYDNNGNTLTKTGVGEQTVYVWNDDNQLTGATVTTGVETKQLSYRYNTNGIRVSSVVDGQETRYLVDENRPYAQVLEEYATNGTVQTRYIYGDVLDLIAQTRSGASAFYLEDGHSGVRQLSDAAGAVTDTYTYDAYGDLLQSTGNTQNSYLYRGEQTDPNLGMQYLRARYYNQGLGRFASTDPFEGWQESPISRHRYAYANVNPVMHLDPTGKFSLPELSQVISILNKLALGALAYGGVVGTLARALAGEISWTGFYASQNIDIGMLIPAYKGLSGSVLTASLKSEPIRGKEKK